MATSGSKDFTATRDEIINGAIRILGRNENYKLERSLELSHAGQALNMMVKSWQAEGIGLWMNVEAALFLDDSNESYDLGSTGDHATASWVKTEVSTAGTSGSSTLVIDSGTGMTSSDNIGVQLDGGTMHWTTISSIPGATTATLTTALTGPTAVDNHVYTYTTKLDRPLEITEVRIRSDANNETTIDIVSRDEYMELSDKDSTGQASMVYYDPQLTNGKLFVWPAEDDLKKYIKFTARLPFDDFDAAANNAEFPVEWLRVLKICLAAELSWEYELSSERIAMLTQRAEMAKRLLENFDSEHGTSVFFVPDRRY